MRNISHSKGRSVLLNQSNGTPSVTVVLADMRDAPAMNHAWDRWLDPAAKPARMTVQAPLADPSWRVEITGVAAVGAPGAKGV